MLVIPNSLTHMASFLGAERRKNMFYPHPICQWLSARPEEPNAKMMINSFQECGITRHPPPSVTGSPKKEERNSPRYGFKHTPCLCPFGCSEGTGSHGVWGTRQGARGTMRSQPSPLLFKTTLSCGVGEEWKSGSFVVTIRGESQPPTPPQPSLLWPGLWKLSGSSSCHGVTGHLSWQRAWPVIKSFLLCHHFLSDCIASRAA